MGEGQANPSTVDDAWDKSLKLTVADDRREADQPQLVAHAAAADRDDDRPPPRVAVGTPEPTPVATMPAQTRQEPVETQPELLHAERSPLSFVMSATEPTTARSQDTHDMSMFVAGLVADTAPVVETPAGTAMQPVMRASRKRRQWIAAAAVAATVVGGAAIGVQLAANDAPKSAAGNAPVVASHVEAPPAPVVPPNANAETASDPAASSGAPSMPGATTPSESTAPSEITATPSVVSATPSKQPADVKKSAPATKSTRAKKSTTAKQPAKRVATKASTTKKSAKKSSSTKATRKNAAKKPTPKSRS